MVCRADAAMKPLPSAPLTREDKLIWLGINVPLNKKHFGYHYSKAYFASDRRDAELMFRAHDEFTRWSSRYMCTLFTDLNPPDMKGMPPIGGVLVRGDQIT